LSNFELVKYNNKLKQTINRIKINRWKIHLKIKIDQKSILSYRKIYKTLSRICW
jgi:hypothetical protein